MAVEPTQERTEAKQPPVDVVVVGGANDSADALTASLRHGQCVVRRVSSVEEALAAIRAHAPEVVVADLELGVDLAARLADELQRDPSTRQVARVVINAPSTADEEVPGFDAYVPQPVDDVAFLGLVRSLAQAVREQRRASRARG